MERVALTTAEIAFLLSIKDGVGPQRARARLRLTGEDQGAAVVRGGLSSLVVRGMAVGDSTNVTLTGPLATVLRGLVEPIMWVEISALTGEAVDAAHLYVHANGMFLLSPRAYGTFVVQGVRRGVAPIELLADIARSVLPTEVGDRDAAVGDP